MLSRTSAFLLALAAAACGAGESAPGGPRVETVDGEERWHYPASPADRLAWSFDTLAVIGDALSDLDAYHFDGVVPSGLAGDGEGDLYVADRAGKRVLRFNARGEHVATYGRGGGGPGELEQPLGLALGPGDSLWVSDFGNQRITVLPTTGGDARGIAYGGDAGMPAPDLRVTGDGYIHMVQPFPFRGPGGPVEEPPTPLVRFNPDGTVADTVWRLPPPPRDVTEISAGTRVARVAVSRGFAPVRRWELLSDGTVVLSHTAEYSIALIGPDGRVIRRIERDPPPRPTTDADRQAERRRRAEQMQPGRGGMVIRGGGGGGPDGSLAATFARSLEEMRFEPVIPRISGLAVDGADRIWVGVSVDEPGEVERIDVYAADGTLLGELHAVPFPDRFFGPDLAARLERDELDVQRVVVLRLNEGGGE